MHRQDKIAAQIKKALSAIISRDMKDPRVSDNNVTVSRVEVSADVSVAKVYFSVMEADELRRDIMKALDQAKGFCRSELAKELKIRHVPVLEFKLDHSIERGMHIMGFLNEIERTGETHE
jgi:ribosome-binding factor A